MRKATYNWIELQCRAKLFGAPYQHGNLQVKQKQELGVSKTETYCFPRAPREPKQRVLDGEVRRNTKQRWKEGGAGTPTEGLHSAGKTWHLSFLPFGTKRGCEGCPEMAKRKGTHARAHAPHGPHTWARGHTRARTHQNVSQLCPCLS